MKIVTVLVKRSRINNHHKFWGGLLNPAKKYYTRKVEANTIYQAQKSLA